MQKILGKNGMQAAGYIRVSQERAAKNGYGLGAQEEDIRRHVHYKRWRLFDVYRENGVSGYRRKAFSHVTHEEREAALKAIAGEEAFAKLGGLLATDLSMLEGWSKELKTGGVIQTAFEQKSRTLGFAWAFLRENFRNTAIVLGQHLLPILTSLVSWIGTAAGK